MWRVRLLHGRSVQVYRNLYRKFKQTFFLTGAISPNRRAVNRASVLRCAIDHSGPKKPSTMPRRWNVSFFFMRQQFGTASLRSQGLVKAVIVMGLDRMVRGQRYGALALWRLWF